MIHKEFFPSKSSTFFLKKKMNFQQKEMLLGKDKKMLHIKIVISSQNRDILTLVYTVSCVDFKNFMKSKTARF